MVVAAGIALLGAASGSASPAGRVPVSVTSSIQAGAVLSGSVVWTATPSGTPTKVDFAVDGSVRWTERAAPYQYGGDPNGVLDTTTLANGSHTLSVKAYYGGGKTATAKVAVTVSNPTSAGGSGGGVATFTVSSSIPTGATLSGSVTWTASTSGASTTKVQFLIDGSVQWTEAYAPYQFDGDPSGVLDTTALSNGSHVLGLVAYASDGRTASASSSVSVSNSTPSAATPPSLSGPIPAPSGTPQVGQTLTAATGTWSGSQPIGYSFQWQRCTSSCTDIAGATGPTYTAATADAGTTLVVRVTATNGAGSAVASSAPTATVTQPSTSSPSSGLAAYAGVNAYRTTDFAQLAAAGVTRVRMDNPSASTITAAAGYGIEVLPIADYEPWPDLNGGKGDKTPPLPQYYQTWADRMIAQWTSLPKPPVAIEVWNEPWLASFWQPKPDPMAYYTLVKVFATEAWKVWPDVKILVSADTVGDPNTTGTNLWRQNLLAADTTGFLSDPRIQPTTHDYVEGRSPTTVTSQPCYWDLDRYRCAYADFKAHGNPDPRVWVTEYGWQSDTVGEQTQADYTTQSMQIFASSGMVAAAYCFEYKSNESWSFNWLRPDNSAKPVVSAVQRLLAGA